jgi:hypothetical protein
MSKRLVDPTFWDDPTIGDLDGHAKYLFLYLISSPRGNSCGLYQISNRVIQFHTGMTADKIDTAMKVLEDTGRVQRSGGWLWVVNQFKHDCNMNNLRVRVQFLKVLAMVPDTELVQAILDKYEVQLRVDHGSVKAQLKVSRALEKIKNSFINYSNLIISRLTPPSPEPQLRLHDHEHDHDDDHDNDHDNDHEIPDHPRIEYPEEELINDGPWSGVPLWAPVAFMQTFKGYDFESPTHHVIGLVKTIVMSYEQPIIEEALRVCGENGAKSVGYLRTVLNNGKAKKSKGKPKLGPKPTSSFAYNPSTGSTRLFQVGDILEPGEEMI